jgi:hypothetical protein
VLWHTFLSDGSIPCDWFARPHGGTAVGQLPRLHDPAEHRRMANTTNGVDIRTSISHLHIELAVRVSSRYSDAVCVDE